MRKHVLLMVITAVVLLSAYSCTQITAPSSPLQSTPTVTPSQTPTVPCGQAAFVPDPALSAAMRTALSKPAGANICVEELSGITSLTVSGVNDYTGLTQCANLEWLSVNGGARIVTAAVKELAGIETLFYYQVNLNDADISSMGANTKLKKVSIRYAAITNLDAFAGLPDLEELNVEYCNLNNIDGVAGLTTLRRLSVYSNAVTDLSPVTNLTGLWFLNVGDNPVSSISGLSGFINLRDLIIAGCNISDITQVESMISLNAFYAASNQIADISALTRNAVAGGLGSGGTVNLQGNPINTTPDKDTYIPFLQSRGVSVVY